MNIRTEAHPVKEQNQILFEKHIEDKVLTLIDVESYHAENGDIKNINNECVHGQDSTIKRWRKY